MPSPAGTRSSRPSLSKGILAVKFFKKCLNVHCSVFIPLSGEFVSFLLSDGCVLPEG